MLDTLSVALVENVKMTKETESVLEDKSLRNEHPADYYSLLVEAMTNDLRNQHTVDEEDGEDFVYMNWMNCLLACLLAVVIFWVERIVWRVLLLRLFIATFVMSVFWNFWLQYQRGVAKNYIIISKGLPEECGDHTITLFGLLSTLFDLLFVIKSQENDKCLRFARAMVVDPIWEITPSVAFMTTVTDIFLTPIGLIASGLNGTFKSLFAGIPVFFIPILTFMLLYIVNLILIMIFKYKVEVPWLLKVAPAATLCTHPKKYYRRKAIVATRLRKK